MSARNAIPAAALAQHIAVLGKTGSGKTSTGKLIIEQVAAGGARVCVLDPIKSDWWGVISSSDGKHPGLPFHVLGGPHGHVPLHAGTGAAVAELVAHGQLPLSVLDMAEFGPGSQHAFFVAFAETLLKRMRGVLYLVLEEAHEFAPKERAGFQQENMAIHFAKKLATAGRSKGIRLVLLTQRTQSLHNAMLGSCETMIVHRLTAPADQKPVVAWLKANVQSPKLRSEIEDSMSSLKTGTGWLCSGEARIFERVQFPRISTFDNSATPTGDSADMEVTGADVDLEQLRAIVGDAVAEAEANDPTFLKKRIRELERQLQSASGGVDPAKASGNIRGLEKRIRELDLEVELLRAENAELWRQLALRNETMNKRRSQLLELQDVLQDLVHRVALNVPPLAELPAPTASADQQRRITDLEAFNEASAVRERMLPTRATKTRHADASRRANGQNVQNGSLGKGERIILCAIAQHAGGVGPEQLTVLTGYKRSSRDTYMQRLRSAGYVEPGWPAIATAAGVTALGSDFEPLPTGRELQAYWLAKLGDGGEARILSALIEAWPDPMTKAELDKTTGYKRSSRDTYLQRLKARRLVEIRGGEVIASEVLF